MRIAIEAMPLPYWSLESGSRRVRAVRAQGSRHGDGRHWRMIPKKGSGPRRWRPSPCSR